MAPSLSPKKTPKKTKVNRQSAAFARATLRPPSLPQWFRQCPVEDEDPFYDSQPPSLPPGPALEACSGADIYYQKGSSKRQKFLVLLPGLVSFDHATAVASKASSNSQSGKSGDDKDDSRVLLTQETIDSLPLTQDSGEGGSTSAASATATSSAVKKLSDSLSSSSANTKLLGQIRGLQGSNTSPTFTLPLDAHRQLEFQGHRVSTNSKFVALTLQPKKGHVVCKDVFDSALVFGNPREVATGENGGDHKIAATPNPAVSDSNNEVLMDENVDDVVLYTDDEKGDNVNGDSITTNKRKAPLEHYGGSARAWDGSMQGKVSGETIAANGMTKKRPAPAAFNKTVHKEEKEDDDIVEDQEYDSDDFHIDLPNAPPVAKRTAPRRQSRKAVKYNELAGADSESSEEYGSDESSVEDDSARKIPSRNGKTGGSSKKTQKPVATKQPPKLNNKARSNAKKTTKAQLEIEITSDDESAAFRNSRAHTQSDDDEDFEIEIKDSISLSQQSSSRRSSGRSRNTPAKSYAEDDESFHDEPSSASEDDTKARESARATKSTSHKPPVKPAARKAATSERKSTGSQKRKLPESDLDVSSPNDDSDSSFDAWGVSPKKATKKKSLTSAPKGASASSRKKPPTKKSKPSSNDDRKKGKTAAIYDSDSDGIPVSKTSAKPKSASSQKEKKRIDSSSDHVETLGQMNVDSSESDLEEFDSAAAKSVLVKGISRGKAARSSPSKAPEKIAAQDNRKNSTTPSSARRRRGGRSPSKSASKPSVIDLVDDTMYSFLNS